LNETRQAIGLYLIAIFTQHRKQHSPFRIRRVETKLAWSEAKTLNTSHYLEMQTRTI